MAMTKTYCQNYSFGWPNIRRKELQKVETLTLLELLEPRVEDARHDFDRGENTKCRETLIGLYIAMQTWAWAGIKADERYAESHKD